MFHLFKDTKNLAPKEAYENLKSDHSITLLDVREAYEYKSGHIQGALLLPVGEIEREIKKLNLDKDALLYVYCQSGVRSKSACSKLVKLGYHNVYNLGGISSWPYEVIRSFE